MPRPGSTAALCVLALLQGAARGEPAPAPAPNWRAPTVAPPPAPGGGVPVAPAERITLDEAVRRALARNPTVATAVAEIARAEALVQQARAGWLPTLVGNGSLTRLEGNRVFNGRTLALAEQFNANAVLTVPLVAPQAWMADRQARDNGRVAQASAVDVRRVIAQATATAYLSVLAQRRQIRSTESALANARAHATFAHTRLVGGLGNALDDVRAQQDVAADEVELQQVYGGLARTREALGVLVGADGPVDSVNEVDFGAVPALGVALSEASERRPDIAAQRAKLTAAEHKRKDIWAAYSPYLSAVGQPFAQHGTVSQPPYGWQAQLLLTLPFYDGGARTGVAHEREALLDEARLGLEATLRQARSEVRIAFEAMLRADIALAAARAAADLARRAYDLATLSYRAGATTNLEIIDAARRVRDADGDVAQAEDVARRARLDLLVSSGRFP